MGHLSYSTRTTVVELWRWNFRLKDNQEHQLVESIIISKKSLCVLIRKYKRMGSVADEQKMKWPRKLQDEYFRFVNNVVAENDQLTSSKLYNMFKEKYTELNVSTLY